MAVNPHNCYTNSCYHRFTSRKAVFARQPPFLNLVKMPNKNLLLFNHRNPERDL